MPLYEYTCRSCEHSFEKLVGARTAQPVRCPQCDGAELDQLIGLPAAGRRTEGAPASACQSDGPPCGAPWCRRKS